MDARSRYHHYRGRSVVLGEAEVVSDTVRVYSIPANHFPEQELYIKDSPQELTQLVGNYFETFHLGNRLFLVVDEEGWGQELPYNFHFEELAINGPALLVPYDEQGHLRDLTDDDIAIFHQHRAWR